MFPRAAATALFVFRYVPKGPNEPWRACQHCRCYPPHPPPPGLPTGRGIDVTAHVNKANSQPMFPKDASVPFHVPDMPDECMELLRSHMSQRMQPHRAGSPLPCNLDEVCVVEGFSSGGWGA